ncbi:MAG: choline ABC transporter permease, partial [Pisciglobus halotolerans]|nr:choline ABC transporter permease [Pisciglobus halotolerans]
IVGGTIPVTLLALLVDYLLGKIETKVTPINLKEIR